MCLFSLCSRHNDLSSCLDVPAIIACSLEVWAKQDFLSGHCFLSNCWSKQQKSNFLYCCLPNVLGRVSPSTVSLLIVNTGFHAGPRDPPESSPLVQDKICAAALASIWTPGMNSGSCHACMTITLPALPSPQLSICSKHMILVLLSWLLVAPF